jgi:hypothetical protein
MTTNGRANIHAIDIVTSANGNATIPVATVIPAPITCDKKGHTYHNIITHQISIESEDHGSILLLSQK